MQFTILRKPLWAAVSALMTAAPVYANIDVAIADVDPILELPLEQLLNIEVTSVMKTPARLSDTPAAIFVLTSEDIRRSGATNITDALRHVPGLHVSKIDANKSTVSARGFSSMFSNKLLVLIDGRTVYTPLFSGVWWDQLDVIMDDIERIEVIRGPGASLWGANAVNGVINITTKSAKNTQGGLLKGYVGNARGGAALRYGAKVGEDAYLKVYGRSVMQGGGKTLDAHKNADDTGRMHKAGFRFEKEVSASDQITIQGDVFDGENNGGAREYPRVSAALVPVLVPPFSESLPTSHDFKGFNLLGRWEHQLSNDSSTSLQMYWDSHERNVVDFNSKSGVDVFDIDFQHNVKLGKSHNVVWGLGYRRNMNDTSNVGNVLVYKKPKRTDNLYSVYVQDNITLVPERWQLTVGSRFDYNPVTHLEVQPNVRLLWTPNKKHSVWASISRAVRTPSWVDQDFLFSERVIPPSAALPVPTLIPVLGDKDVISEELVSYELGWRGSILPNLTADVAVYYYDYDHLATTIPNALDLSNLGAGYAIQSLSFGNKAKAETYGGEVSLDWRVVDSWRLRASYSYFEIDADFTTALSPEQLAFAAINFSKTYPQHQAMLWSQHQLSPTVNLDLNLRYVDKLEGNLTPSYTALDARLAWAVSRDFELALVGRNLLNSGHPEYIEQTYAVATDLPRELFITGSLHF